MRLGTTDNLTAISLFSSAGIGDLALQHLPVDVLVSCELLEERHQIFQHNFPSTLSLTGDIWKLADEIVEQTNARLAGRELDLLFATPPCQGMSKNGRGKLLQGIREGKKPAFDERNRLIIPTLAVAKSLQPRALLFENVPEMEDTLILDEDGRAVGIIDYIHEILGSDYDGRAEVVEFADYGVPQRRHRLISVFTRDPLLRRQLALHGTLLPPPSHSSFAGAGLQPWVTVRDTISHLPPLDASQPKSARGELPLHFVPLLDETKYFWVKNTPPEKAAFDNQCAACGHDQNPGHGAKRGKDGINRASTETPIRCVKCAALLPRPWVVENGQHRLMRGYTSAYKRMRWDFPASALTTNFPYACSDNKLHPEQHRVLSVLEALMLHTVTHYRFEFRRSDGAKVPVGVIHEVIGESIPPRGLEVIFQHLVDLLRGLVVQSDVRVGANYELAVQEPPAAAFSVR
jgi:DNA (cytosine-5)-methyltransferase 1